MQNGLKGKRRDCFVTLRSQKSSQHYNKDVAQQSQGGSSDLEAIKPEEMDFSRLHGTLLASGLWWYAYVEHLLQLTRAASMTVSQSWTLRVESVADLQRWRFSGENLDNLGTVNATPYPFGRGQ